MRQEQHLRHQHELQKQQEQQAQQAQMQQQQQEPSTKAPVVELTRRQRFARFLGKLVVLCAFGYACLQLLRLWSAVRWRDWRDTVLAQREIEQFMWEDVIDAGLDSAWSVETVVMWCDVVTHLLQMPQGLQLLCEKTDNADGLHAAFVEVSRFCRTDEAAAALMRVILRVSMQCPKRIVRTPELRDAVLELAAVAAESIEATELWCLTMRTLAKKPDLGDEEWDGRLHLFSGLSYADLVLPLVTVAQTTTSERAVCDWCNTIRDIVESDDDRETARMFGSELFVLTFLAVAKYAVSPTAVHDWSAAVAAVMEHSGVARKEYAQTAAIRDFVLTSQLLRKFAAGDVDALKEVARLEKLMKASS